MSESIASFTSLYHRQHALLSIYLTNKCNLECRHCGTGSGPSETSYLKVDADTLASIGDAIRADGIEGLHVSGGEPFMRRDDLRLLAALAGEHGIRMAINTNGFWGTSPQAAARLLNSMPGITDVILSTDMYHAEFLATEKLIVAAQAALSIGLQVLVVTTTLHRQPTPFTDQLDHDLAHAGILGQVQRCFQQLGPTARATPLPEVVQVMSRELPAGPCQLLNRPTLLENGSVLACCNTPLAERCASSPLDLGNIAVTPLRIMLRQGRERKLLQGLRLLGPAILAGSLTEEQREHLPRLYVRDDICTLCTDLVTNRATVSALEAALDAPALGNLLQGAVMMDEVNHRQFTNAGL